MDIQDSFLQSVLDAQKKDIFSSLRVMMPGTIVSYNSFTGLASVQPGLRRKSAANSGLSGSSAASSAPSDILTAPILSDVPVLLPSSDFQPASGSPCLLLFADFCLDGWLESKQPVLPPSSRQHDLSDAIALVGYFPAFTA